MKQDLKCPSCGAPLEYNQATNIATCSSCGSRSMIKEDKIAYEFNSVQNITKNIYGNVSDDIDDYLSKGDTYLSLKEYEAADTEYNKAISDKPSDYRGWLALARLAVAEYQAGVIFSINENLFENAIKLAPDDLKEMIDNEYRSIKKETQKNLETLNNQLKLEQRRREENITDELLNIPAYLGEVKKYQRSRLFGIIYILISFVVMAGVIVSFILFDFERVFLLIIGAVDILFLLIGLSECRYYQKNKILIPLLNKGVYDLSVLKKELGMNKEGEVLSLIHYNIKKQYVSKLMVKDGEIVIANG